MTFLFTDVSGWAYGHLDWLARVQLMPALLSLNVVAIVILVALTLLFGRIYCSVICPLGIYQDFIGRLRKLTAGRKRRKIGLFRYTPARSKARYIVLGAFIFVVLMGLLNIMAVSLASFIEPYSAFGRMVTAFVSPGYDAVNNRLADWSAEQGTYEYTPIHRAFSLAIFIVAALTFVVVTTFAWIGGRDYCNTVCPVGTILGFMSRYAWLRPVINADKCNGCHSCERHCKAKCIDSADKAIDYSRCVACMDCIGQCRQGAISFRHPSRNEAARRVSKVAYIKPSAKPETESERPLNASRRAFLATSGTLTGIILAKGAGKAVEKVTDGGLTPLKERKAPARKVRMVPPGAISQAHINQHCVGCQLCIQACPNGLLTPSTDVMTFMQPVMQYSGEYYCTPECTRCSNVCPAGVFHPLDEAEKSSWKIGTAVVDFDMCLSATGTARCGNCARHCPAGAIEMVPDADGSGMVRPIVNVEACIGCGSCEVHCPVGTVASMSADAPAIYVEGIDRQRLI